MTLNPFASARLIRPRHTGLLLGSVGALALAAYAFVSGWLNWRRVCRSHPLLTIPNTLAPLVTPVLLYVSIGQMTDTGMGWRLVLVVSAALCMVSVGLVAVGIQTPLESRTFTPHAGCGAILDHFGHAGARSLVKA